MKLDFLLQVIKVLTATVLKAPDSQELSWRSSGYSLAASFPFVCAQVLYIVQFRDPTVNGRASLFPCVSSRSNFSYEGMAQMIKRLPVHMSARREALQM